MSDEKIRERVAEELSAIAFASASDFVEVIEDEEGQHIRVKDKIPSSSKRAICAIRKTKDGINVETPDKLKAIELLGKYLGMFSQSAEKDAASVVIEGVVGE